MRRRQSERAREDRQLLRWSVAEFGMGDGAHLALPPVVEGIAEAVGRRKALELADFMALRHRGRRRRLFVPYPRNLTPDHWLMHLLGPEAALAFAEAFASIEMEIPSCRDLRMARRDAAIAHLAREGMSMLMVELRTSASPEVVAEVCRREGLPIPYHVNMRRWWAFEKRRLARLREIERQRLERWRLAAGPNQHRP